MKCVICRSGETNPGKTTFTVNRDGHTFVLRDVPGNICEQCGEGYFDEAVTEKAYDQVEQASRSGVDVAVLTYQAA
jgi:YgiT-type zinc finger domain-containing protein